MVKLLSYVGLYMINDWIHCCFKDRFVEAIFFLYLVYLKTHIFKKGYETQLKMLIDSILSYRFKKN